MKKAQLTLFIIIGLVIVGVFGFVFFANSVLQRSQIETQAERAISQLIEANALRFYVNQCTERGIKNGLEIISKQGGKIFPGQMGSLMQSGEKALFREEDGKTYLVAYGILKSNLPIPQYPCSIGTSSDFKLPPAFCAYNSKTSKFNGLEMALPNLPKLCKDKNSGCDAIIEKWDTRFSIQAQLESFVSEYVKKCVDFDSVVGINNTYNITEGEITTSIILSDNKITANVNFPIVAEIPGTQPVISMLKFQKTIPTRFKQAYSIARSVVVSDLTSPSAKNYNITKEFKNLVTKRFASQNSGFTLTILEDLVGYDDLVIISDSKAYPEYPLNLQFMIENRQPVLEYFEEAPYKAACKDFDYYVMQDRILRIEPSAFDMDDNDKLTYSYSGWLEDYNESFSPSDPEIDEKTKCPIVETEQIPLNGNQKRLVKHNIEGIFTGIVTSSLALTEYDIGYHMINLTVCDAQYCDYQEIRVLVDDLVKLFVNKTSKYNTPEFRESFSLEDPVTFTAKIRDIYKPYPADTEYKFHWRIENIDKEPLYYLREQTQSIAFPSDENIITIKKTMTNLESIYGTPLFALVTPPLTYYMVGSVDDGIENRTSFVPVECIPFNNGKDPFPYNTSDPYLTNHACCNSGINSGTLKSSSAVCFSKTTYGSFKSFDLDEYTTSYDKLPDAQKISPSKIESGGIASTISNMQNELKAGFSGNIPGYANDIIVRSFERKCDGTRGNVCVGNGVQIFTAKECTDKNIDNGEITTCNGPPKEYLLGREPIETQLSCVYDYSGTNVERVLGITNNIECNLNSRCVSSQNSDTGYSSPGNNPRYVCNATCSSSGCTKTLPSICHDCYKDQKCEITGTGGAYTSATPKQGYSFTVKKFNTCLGSSCKLDTTYPKDSCTKIDGVDYVVDYYCLADITSATDFLKSGTIPCRDVYEEEAVDEDGGDNTAAFGKCTAKVESTCNLNGNGAGQCDDMGYEDFYEYNKKISGNSHFVEYVKVNKYGKPGVLESCVEKEYDYDALSKFLCEWAGFTWTGKPGQAACCGDDSGETC